MKRLLLIFLLLISFGSRGAITVLSSVTKQFGTTRVFNTAISTTGASLIVVGLTYRASEGAHFKDTLGNTWTQCNAYAGTGFTSGVTFFYCVNPTTSANHYFGNWDGSGTSYYGGFSVFALSGTATSSPLDLQNGQYIASLSSTATPGSITPSENNCIVFTGCMNFNGTAPTIPTGYTGFNWTTGTAYAGGCGYKIQTTAGAENPSWGNMNVGSNGAVNILSIKEPSTAPTANAGFFWNMVK